MYLRKKTGVESGVTDTFILEMKVMGAATLAMFISVMSEVHFYADPEAWLENFKDSATQLWDDFNDGELNIEIPAFTPWEAFSWPSDLPLLTQMPLIISAGLLGVQMLEQWFKFFYRKWGIEDWNEKNSESSEFLLHRFFMAINSGGRWVLELMLLFPVRLSASLRKRAERRRVKKITDRIYKTDGEEKKKLTKKRNKFARGHIDDERVADFIKNNPDTEELNLTGCYKVKKLPAEFEKLKNLRSVKVSGSVQKTTRFSSASS